MNQIILQRYFDNGVQTIGGLYLPDSTIRDSYILEDTYRPVKIKHQTRIPAGIYPLKFRKFGRHYGIYKDKYADQGNDRGMIEICNVPNYTDILYHTGIKDRHTSGCLLSGTTYHLVGEDIELVSSRKAYRKMYPIIAGLMEEQQMFLKIKDEGNFDINISIRDIEKRGSIN